MDTRRADQALERGEISMAEFIKLADLGFLETPVEKRARCRRQGHRMGLILTALGLLLFIFGIMMDGHDHNSGAPIPGILCFFLGYPLARLWFWFKAA